MSFSMDYASSLLEEIALEGLDGITLQGLWLRLEHRPDFPIKPIYSQVKVFLWKIITRLANVEFFELPTPREPLEIFNRFDYVDASGNYMEPEHVPPCIYPHKPVVHNGIKGSCSTFFERLNVTIATRMHSLNEAVDRWGDKLVMVADQNTRRRALSVPDFNPLTEMTDLQYCVLERVGRARYSGEVTQGKFGLQIITEDSKMLFYYRKFLSKHKLITKQVFYLKVGKQNCTGSLLHLPKFAMKVHSRHKTDKDKIVEFLKQKPGHFALYKDVTAQFDVKGSIKKILQKHGKIFKAEMVPYRQIYPNAHVYEWKMKSGVAEKSLRILKLTDPTGDVDHDDDEDDDDDENGLLDTSFRRLDRSMIRQCYAFVEQAGPRGLTQGSLGTLMASPSLQARCLCKYLLKRNICATALIDLGRQRINHFYSKKFDNSKFTMKNEMIAEKNKLMQMVNPPSEESPSKSDSGLDSTENTPKPPKKELKVVEEKGPSFFKNILKDPLAKPSQEDIDAIETKIVAAPVNPLSDKTFPSLTGGDLTSNASPNNLTVRILRRANLILQAVNTHRVIHDPQKLQRMINEEETSEGFMHTVDRKTVQRLIEKLETDGHVRTIKVTLKGHGKEKNMTFICHPSVTENHSEIQSAIEQAKMKLPIITKDALKKSNTDRLAGQVAFTQNLKYDQKAGRRYGFKPKFVRMQILHTYMYYLIYGYSGSEITNEETIKSIAQEAKEKEDFTEEMSTLYHETIDWKMFIPPLPQHADYNDGWCLISDLLVRLPLSLFVAIVNVPYKIPMLTEYLTHPVRKYFLVKHLPQQIANHLTINRKYIFSISEVVSRLGYIGLLQMGPQKLKEKDQVFVYLNRNAILMDTTTSDIGYNHISQSIKYEQMNYTFNSIEDVEQYWYDLWNFAMHTNLGCRTSMTGQPVVIESVTTKKQLIEAVRPKDVEESRNYDVGYLPGDQLGAAGLDSDMFVHLKRNWYWTTEGRIDATQPTGKSILDPPSIKATNARSVGRKSTPAHNLKTKTGNKKSAPPEASTSELDTTNKEPAEKEMMDTSEQFPESSVIEISEGPDEIGPTPVETTSEKTEPKPQKGKPKKKLKHKEEKLPVPNSRAKHKKITRIVKPKKTRFARKPYYDQVDKEALRRMVKLRVDWSSAEDNLLLICKVASLYMTTNSKRHIAKNFCVIREILHNTYPEISKNKTSRACQRRMHYMMKNPSTAHSVYMCLEEIKQDPDINDQFSSCVEELDARLKSKGEGPKGFQKDYDKIFSSLVSKLFSKLKTITNKDETTLDNISIPDSIDEFKKTYNIVVPKDLTFRYGTFNEVQSTVDIHSAVVNTIIHSSLCCTTDKTSYSYQLFFIYQQYPDKLLRRVMAKCRTMSIVSCRKKYKKWKTAHSGCLPLSSSPYQLSITYVNILQTKFQYSIFSEAHSGLSTISEQTDSNLDETAEEDSLKGVLLNVTNGGECANVVELYSAGFVEMDVKFPEHLIVLDPRLAEKEESYKLIMKRFKEMLSIITASKTSKDKANSDDEDEDEEVNPTEGTSQTQTKDEDYEREYGEEFNLSNKSGVANTASRLALYMMRDEPSEYLDKSLQHAHDYFVLKPCKISIELDKDEAIKAVSNGVVKSEIVNEIKKLSVFPETHEDSEDIINELKESHEETLLRNLIFTIEDKKELGATYQDIEDEIGSNKAVADALLALVLKQFILKTGSVSVRYVHNKFAKPWLIKSYFIPRLKREQIGASNVNTSYHLDIGKGDEDDEDDVPAKRFKSSEKDVSEEEIQVETNTAEDEPIKMELEAEADNSEKMEAEAENSEKKEAEADNSEKMEIETDSNVLSNDEEHKESTENVGEEKPTKRNVVSQRKRRWVTLPKENQFNEMDFSTMEPIHVSLRPWVRVDGTVNHRVLNRLLGSVLGHCLTFPGATMKNVQDRFVPALQPAHTNDLMEILIKIGCISVKRIRKSHKSTLFSSRSTITLEESYGFGDLSSLVVEPENLAISRLGHFIGKTAYSTDYLDALTYAKLISHA